MKQEMKKEIDGVKEEMKKEIDGVKERMKTDFANLATKKDIETLLKEYIKP